MIWRVLIIVQQVSLQGFSRTTVEKILILQKWCIIWINQQSSGPKILMSFLSNRIDRSFQFLDRLNANTTVGIGKLSIHD